MERQTDEFGMFQHKVTICLVYKCPQHYMQTANSLPVTYNVTVSHLYESGDDKISIFTT